MNYVHAVKVMLLSRQNLQNGLAISFLNNRRTIGMEMKSVVMLRFIKLPKIWVYGPFYCNSRTK